MASLPESVRDFLDQKRIAVAGVSRGGDQPANAIYKRLKETGHEVIPVNPATDTAEGETCYASLGAIPGEVDAVMVVTHPDATEQVVNECLALGIQRIWMHRSFGTGSVSKEAVDRAREAGATVIEGGCPLMYAGSVDPFHRCMRWWLGLRGRVPTR